MENQGRCTSPCSGLLLEWDDWECAPLRSAHHQRNNYFIFRVCRGLRTAPNAFSREEFGTNSLSQNLTVLLAPSEREPLTWRYSFRLNRKACERSRSRGGGAVAQRLRGYKWRSEKSVKAIAPTGAALAFLCFDFFFRIVKGVQPLARCGVGGVQR